jgi:dTDP-4-dehydrorhamnose reductase
VTSPTCPVWPTPSARCVPTSSSTPRPHRRRQGRERTRTGPHHQCPGPEVLAKSRPNSVPGWCTTAPTTCLTAAAAPRVESAPTGPLSCMAAPSSKAKHSSARAAPPPHLPHQLGVRRPRRQLCKDHAQLAAERDRLTIINDQHGAPTGADLLADVTAHAVRMTLADAYLAAPTTSCRWRDHLVRLRPSRHRFARAQGAPLKVGQDILPVPTSAFPTPAPARPTPGSTRASSSAAFGLKLPHWQVGVNRMLAEIL